ncbi:MAG: nucleotide sugar dehydrogenase [Conexivisphaerales archaeon]
MRLKIAVLGAGRVGTTIAAALLRAGFEVTVADTNANRIDAIKKRVKIFRDEPMVNEVLSEAIGKTLTATADAAEAVSQSRVVIIAVPVGLNAGEADFTYLLQAARDIARSLNKQSLVVLETSVPPGTTRNVLKREIESISKLRAGEDFMLSYSPERISEGRALADLEDNYPKIVSGIDNKSLDEVSALYSKVARKGIIRMSSLEAAEAAKLFEGVYRDTNIALANELASFCEKIGLDYWEIMNAANSQPYSHLHKPGAGVGGACIPVYPVFVTRLAEKEGESLQLVKTARKINESQPLKIAEEAANLSGLKDGDKVAVLGLSFRGDVADDRLSPAYTIASYFAKRKAKVVVQDPIAEPSLNSENFLFTRSVEDALKNAKLVVIATDHSQYKELGIAGLRRMNPDAFVYDARAVFRNRAQSDARTHIIGIGKGKQT